MSHSHKREASGHPGVSVREMLLSTAGALISLLITVVIARLLLTPSAQPFLVASMGATAVLLYAASASPMAQPWAVLAGHLVSALVGVSCARYIVDPAWAAALAGSGAILAMYLLRCMHPPGGATALMPVASAGIGDLGYSYVLAPVGVDVLLMLVLALLINHYLLRRPYPASRYPVPNRPMRAGLAISQTSAPIQAPFDSQDLQHALQQMDTYIDVTHQDLLRIYHWARISAYARKAGDRPCSDFMQPSGATLLYGTPLAAALQALQGHNHSALPVVSPGGHVLGVLALDDLLRHAAQQPGLDPIARLTHLVTPSGRVHSDKPEAVGQVMQTQPFMATAEHPVRELLHHPDALNKTIIPIVAADKKLLGVIDLGTLMAQLHRLPTPVLVNREPAID